MLGAVDADHDPGGEIGSSRLSAGCVVLGVELGVHGILLDSLGA
jgi:hypothetical protein